MIGFEIVPGGQGAPLAADPMAAYFRPPVAGQVALAAGRAGALDVWTDVGDGHAARLTFDSDDPGLRASWRETWIAPLRRVYTVGQMTLSGSWSQLQSSGSGRSGSYTGNRAISTSSTGAAAEVRVARDQPYDLWVVYTGRTGGGYLRVEIDGQVDLINEVTDPGGLGFPAISTYAPIDLTRRQSVKVASGLTGAHDVTLSLGGAASPGGSAIMLEAVAISAALTDPGILPPVWQPNTSYQMGDEVQFEGTYYAARASGISGATPPSHLDGIASDGALDWRADDRPSYPEFVAIDYASEREYALRFAYAGATSEIGGQTHGNDHLITREVLLDGQPWVAAQTQSGLSVGQTVTLRETVDWRAGAAGSVGSGVVTRQIAPGDIRCETQMDMTAGPLDIAWFYVGMLPGVHWDGESKGTVFRVFDGGAEPVSIGDFAGAVPPDVPFGAVPRVGALADIGPSEGGQAQLIYGLETKVITPDAPLIGFLRPNIDGRDASGSVDWPAKYYAQLDVSQLISGDSLRFFSRHALRVTT